MRLTVEAVRVRVCARVHVCLCVYPTVGCYVDKGRFVSY